MDSYLVGKDGGDHKGYQISPIIGESVVDRTIRSSIVSTVPGLMCLGGLELRVITIQDGLMDVVVSRIR